MERGFEAICIIAKILKKVFVILLTLIEAHSTSLGLDLCVNAGFRFKAHAKTLSDGILLTLIETCPFSLGLDLW